MADDLLDDAVAERDGAGHGEMCKHAAGEAEEAECAGTAAVKLRQAANQAAGLEDDVGYVHQRPRADRRHQRDALGGVQDHHLCLRVERAEDFGFRQPHQIAAIDDVAAEIGQRAPACGGLRLGRHEGREFVHDGARRLRIVAGDGVECPALHLFHFRKSGDGDEFPGQDDQQGKRRDAGHACGQPAEPLRPLEQGADQAVRPQADSQRQEGAKRTEEDRGQQGAPARRCRRRRFGHHYVGFVEDVDLRRDDDGRFQRAGLSGRFNGPAGPLRRFGGLGCFRFDAEGSRLAGLRHARRSPIRN